jgi:hypothetical protein
MKTKTAPSLVPTTTPAVVNGFTLGLDLGDHQHHVCVLDAAGQIIRKAGLTNTRPRRRSAAGLEFYFLVDEVPPKA